MPIAESKPSPPRPRRIPAWPFVVASLGLIGVNLVLLVVRRARPLVPDELWPVVQVSHDQSLHSWLTILATSLAGVVAILTGAVERARTWKALGALLLALSADDFVRGHERLGQAVYPVLGERTSIYGWVIVLGPVLAALGLGLFFSIVRLLETAADRRRVFAGFAALGVALGLEVLEGPIDELGIVWRGFNVSAYGQLVEEFLELLGPALLLEVVSRRLFSRRCAPPPRSSR